MLTPIDCHVVEEGKEDHGQQMTLQLHTFAYLTA